MQQMCNKLQREGGIRAPMIVVQRLGNLFVSQTNFTDLSVKQETVHFICISLLMKLLFPDRPSALLTTIDFQQKLHWPRFKLNLLCPKANMIVAMIDCCNALQGNPNTLDC